MKIAFVLFNLGGPSALSDVKPYLVNLFSDPAIITLSNPWRKILAEIIAWRRAPVARQIYAQLGGGSPLLKNTQAQRGALEQVLATRFPDDEVRGFVAMRHWHPFTQEAVAEVQAWQPDRLVLLPLYPQFSTTTVKSALKAWDDAAMSANFHCPTVRWCCYPTESGFVNEVAGLLKQALKGIQSPYKVLFSAHGLPEKIVNSGDPYPEQVQQTVEAVVNVMKMARDDWQICYQSRVGPLKWLEPSTETAMSQTIESGRSVVLVPITFVSENSETVYEMDIEYAALARQMNARDFRRVSTVQVGKKFIEGLADMVVRGVREPAMTVLGEGPCSGCALQCGKGRQCKIY